MKVVTDLAARAFGAEPTVARRPPLAPCLAVVREPLLRAVTPCQASSAARLGTAGGSARLVPGTVGLLLLHTLRHLLLLERLALRALLG